MINRDWATICGAYCGNCEELETCGGCATRVAQMASGPCAQHQCCTEVKQLEHCGLCDEFPCELVNAACFKMPPEEQERNRELVIRTLSRRARLGTTTWLREVAIYDGAD